MKLFSERFGYGPKREALQLTDMNADLRNSLWNVLEPRGDDFQSFVATRIAKYVEKAAVDRILTPSEPDYTEVVYQYLMKATWWKVYNTLEIVIQVAATAYKQSEYLASELESAFNDVLQREMSAWRIQNGLVIPISNEGELAAIGEAVERSAKAGFVAAGTHIQNALKNLGERPTGNYPNAVTEAVLAVESACKVLTDDENGTLGSALKKLEGKRTLHPAFKLALDKLYGYASDTVRHGQTEPVVVNFATAKFMVVTCSAILNFLLDSARAQGLPDHPEI